jgi:chaperonin GroES
MMNFRPMSDCVLIKQDIEKQGIIALLKADKLAQGYVVAVGPGKMTPKGQVRPVQLTPGDKVVFGEHVGQKQTINGQDYLIMHEGDIAGVIDADTE